MSSPWTHAICRSCYAKLEPGREPVELNQTFKDSCCWCGKPSSIYYRHDPKTTPCRGATAVHQ